MADTKISALTELAAPPAVDDIVPLVDVSDTSEAASGTDKKIKAARLAPLIVRRTADSSAKTNNTLADDDTLLWPVAANEEWFCMAFLKISAANATMDFQAAFTCPSGGTIEAGAIAGGGGVVPVLAAITASSTQLAQVGSGTNIFAGSSGNATLNGINAVGLYCWLTNGATPGNGVLQWAQQTTNASNLILKKNSFLQLTRLA